MACEEDGSRKSIIICIFVTTSHSRRLLGDLLQQIGDLVYSRNTSRETIVNIKRGELSEARWWAQAMISSEWGIRIVALILICRALPASSRSRGERDSPTSSRLLSRGDPGGSGTPRRIALIAASSHRAAAMPRLRRWRRLPGQRTHRSPPAGY